MTLDSFEAHHIDTLLAYEVAPQRMLVVLVVGDHRRLPSRRALTTIQGDVSTACNHQVHTILRLLIEVCMQP